MTDGLAKFIDRIYVSNNNELKKLTLREFHVKLYSSHLGYQKPNGCEEVLLLDESKERGS